MAFHSADSLEGQASHVVSLLKTQGERLVLAESCTAGLVAATLGLIPGVSQFLCGSAVVYRVKTKIDWLGVDKQLIGDHTAESEATSIAIGRGSLERTPEATVSLGITGHFGPGCPDHLDGKIYVACCRNPGGELVGAKSWSLTSKSRADRQKEAALLALKSLSSWLISQES